MTQLPPDELAALDIDMKPGTVVCELGNKKNSTGVYRDWYADQGLNYLCIDWNGEDGALTVDMTQPDATKGLIDTFEQVNVQFEVVTNFGFTEHVGTYFHEQEECWRNVHSLVVPGGWLVMCMPMMPDWKGHGMWMPEPKWYTEFALKNGYMLDHIQIWDRLRRTIVCRMRKGHHHEEFKMPINAKILRSDI